MAAVASPDSLTGSDSPRSWRGVLDAYAEPRLGRSMLDLVTSVVPYVALLVAMVFVLRVSVLLSPARLARIGVFGPYVHRVPRLHAWIVHAHAPRERRVGCCIGFADVAAVSRLAA